MDIDSTRALITRHEQYRAKVYIDTLGNPTIGVGYRLNQVGARNDIESIGGNYDDLLLGKRTLTNEQVDKLFMLTLTRTIAYCHTAVPVFDKLPDPAQAVLCDMMFNLGPGKFAEFHGMIAAYAVLDYMKVIREMVDSEWYMETKSRAAEDCALIANLIKREMTYDEA